MINKTVGLVLLSFLAMSAYSFEVPLAEFQTTTENDQLIALDAKTVSRSIFTSLTVHDRQGLIGFKYNDQGATGGFVKSQFDASRVCEIYGWEVVIYGQIITKNYGYDVEIKIYSHPDRQVKKTFLLRSSSGDLESLLTDSASKIFSYFQQLLKLENDSSAFSTDVNSIATSHTIEWWGTVPPWSTALVAIAGYHGTLGFRLGTPLWTNGEWSWIQELGLGFGFHFGWSAPGVIDSRLYDIDVGPRATWALVWQRQREFRISVEPGVKIHVLNYQPLYGDNKTDLWVWYGGLIDFEYRFWLDAERTFGMGLQAGVAAYFASPFYLDYRVGIDFAWKGALK